MKMLKNLYLLLIAAMMMACSTPFEVVFEPNDKATIHITGNEQCLWLPIDNEAESVKLTIVDNEKIT